MKLLLKIVFLKFALISTEIWAIDAPSQNRINIPSSPLSLTVPHDFKTLTQDIIDIKWAGRKHPPLWVVGNELATTTISYGLNPFDISTEPFNEVLQSMKSGLTRMTPGIKWVDSKIIELSGKQWVYFEFTSNALDTDIHNIMLITSYKKEMILLNFNSTTGDFDRYKSSLRQDAQSIEYKECSEKVRLMSKTAYLNKRSFDDFWIVPNRDFLHENLPDYGKKAELLFDKAIQSAFDAGKASWNCNELSEEERHYWANHHIAATSYLKMSIGLADESWKDFQHTAFNLENLESEFPYGNKRLTSTTDKYVEGTYYSAAHMRTSAAIALMVLGKYSESKTELIKAGNLIKLGGYGDVKNGLHVINEVTSSLFVLPRNIVSIDEAISFVPVGIDLAMSLHSSNVSYKDVIKKTPKLAELIDYYAIALKATNKKNVANIWMKAISDSGIETPWRASGSEFHSAAKELGIIVESPKL